MRLLDPLYGVKMMQGHIVNHIKYFIVAVIFVDT
jgi:hypothetical protein